MEDRSVVMVFVRVPRAGRVKTRLAAGIGAGAALTVYRRLAERVVREARRLPRVHVRLHYTPADGGAEVRGWLAADDYVAQAEGGLGERLGAAFDQAFADGFTRVLVVGSDVPELRASHLREALAELAAGRAVVGPARDGGYYLLGLVAPAPGLFAGIDWSTDRVLRQTLERAERMGLTVRLLEVLADIDTVEDLAVWETTREGDAEADDR
jgi:uncharacterized protein